MTFVYLDIDDPGTSDLKQTLGYRYQPHYVLIDPAGNVVNSWVGIVDEEEFVTAFEALLD